MGGRAVNTLWETVPLRSQRSLKSPALKLSGLPPALVVVADDPAQGAEPGERDGCRLMLEVTALGKGQSCFAPGAGSYSCYVV